MFFAVNAKRSRKAQSTYAVTKEVITTFWTGNTFESSKCELSANR
jgi:hypothetical protein